MGKIKVIVDYTSNRYSDQELIVKATTIGNDLTDNPSFPTLAEVATEIKAKNAAFINLLSKVSDGNKQVTIEKNQTREALEDLLSSTAIKVQDISNGNEQLILSAGFYLKRKPAPVGLLERPSKVTVKENPTRGSLEISWDVVPNAYIYELQYTEAPSSPDSKWIRISISKHKTILDGLVSGKAYAIQVAGVGSDPSRVWSDKIISYVM